MKSTFRRLSLVAASIPGLLIAQEQSADTARIAPVVVSATRTPVSQSALPMAVTVITGDELRARGITTVADALTSVTSASVVQSGSAGATTSLFLRGGESKYVKVLIDGVAANDPGGAYDFASLTTDNIERIEVVRGPASVIYGADAVTGVVQVITRHGFGAPLMEVDVSGGSMPRDRGSNAGVGQASMSAFDGSAAIHGAVTSGSYSLSIATHLSEGLYEVNNEYRNNVLSGRFQLSPTERTDVRFSVRYNDYRFNYPTSGGGTATPGDVNAFRTEDRTVLGVELEQRHSASQRFVLALSSSVNDGGTDDRPDAVGGSSFVSQDKMRRRSAELRGHLAPSSATALTVGAQIEQQDQRSQFQSDGAFGPFNDEFAASRRNTGLYAELIATPLASVTATLGARLDDNERFGTFSTGRVGVSWRPVSRTRIRSTAGTAFREPTFLENYSTGFVTGNPELEPERARSIDVGIDQELFGGAARVGITGFAQRFENMIDFTGSTAACGFSFCNVAAARSHGAELEFRARFAELLQLSAGGTLLRTRVLTPGFDNTSGGLYKDGESLIRRPEHKWNAELAYRPSGRVTAAVRWLAVGQRTDRDFRPFPATPVVLPAYQRVDLSAQYAVHVRSLARTALTLRVENVANAHYENVFNFLAPRRTISVGVRSRF